MNIPRDLLYCSEHCWVKVEYDVATIGITDFAQRELGDIVYVDVEESDEIIKQGTPYGTIEAIKTASDLFMPIEIQVLEVNPQINDYPEFINKDPYGKGWILKGVVKDFSTVESLLSAEEYEKIVK